MGTMLQPRSTVVLLLLGGLLVNAITGDYTNVSPRRRRQEGEDVTTVLLVDSHGRSTFGRFLSVKPDLGLITSTARTFIQEGVTTEYATQVLGTTLDNGRLYAHLLTKSSRVLYDNDAPTRTPQSDKKKWHVDSSVNSKANFVKNTDYISPNKIDDPFVVFPTRKPQHQLYISSNKLEKESSSEEELLSAPSNNPRVPFEPKKDDKPFLVTPLSNNNVKVFQINPQQKQVDNYKDDSEENDVIRKDEFGPSKVREWENLPTFTVRNEFSPSGFSFLGDLPDFDVNTERSKPTTAAERRAKLLFKGGIPNKHDLKTVTYTGFADFTTTVGDTVIVFTPQTVEVQKPPSVIAGHVTKIKGEATIKPTPSSLHEPQIATNIKTFLNHEPGVVTETVEGHKLTMQKMLPTMVIEAVNRKPKQGVVDEHEDVEAKSAVLAHEQQATPVLEQSVNSDSTMIFASDLIEPSESQLPPMLSTPSDEEIAKIFASLQAAQATEPLNTPATIFFDDTTNTPSTIFFDELTSSSTSGGATTIFFEDEPITSTAIPDIPTTTPAVEEEITTIKEDVPTTNLKEDTESDEILERQTTENIAFTTQKEEITTNEITTTEKEITTTTEDNETTTVLEVDEDAIECTSGSKIFPSTVYKTLTYLTTFFIPDGDSTSTSVRSNEVVSGEVVAQTKLCIEASAVETTVQATEEPTTTTEKEADITTTTEEEAETTPSEITTERRHVTESEPETTEMTTENGDEIELVFKTFYTTYTYLTTYFQESTSSIASRKVVVTNVITSTLDSGIEATVDGSSGVTGDFKTKSVTFEDFAEIAPSGVGIGRPTSQPSLNGDDSNVLEHNLDNILKATPALTEENLIQTANAIKTYYTTYTYFTTIFVDGETEISSRTEVYTNYVTPTTDGIEATKVMNLNVAPSNVYNSTVNRLKSDDENSILLTVAKGPVYNTLQRTTTEASENELLDLSEYETISTMVTDVRSSTSEGDRRIIDNVDKRNVLLDDQIVSESNNESEIIPSPTLLLQTSYTTFTYFTTMYQGTTSSNVVSRLETVTNVVTETLTPTQSLHVDDLNLPITYFTTFTYWTTLYKEGTTKITSREETVSNIVTPTVPAATSKIEPTAVANNEIIKPTDLVELEPSKKVDEDDQTTFYTTYTYYTTSYIGNSTVLNSRLETVTNVLGAGNKSDVDTNQIGRAIGQNNANRIGGDDDKAKTEESVIKPTGLLSTVVDTVENDGVKTVLSTDVYGSYINGVYAQVVDSTSFVVTPSIKNLKPTGVVSINEGKIVDADSISTLFYTTKAVGKYIDNLYAQVIESTSSLHIDEVKKALQTEAPVPHRTGLVRLIEGSIVHNHTTTLYQSKVLGTVIEGRYAQIIESTSSFIVEPTMSTPIEPTATQSPGLIASTSIPITPSPVVIEGSISDSAKVDEETTTTESIDEDDDENSTEDVDANGRVKSRLTFQSRKRTFTPIIRPFASRSKPTFAPKRKGNKQSSATTITRSDFTPTVTAIPATKSSNRFGGGRKSSAPSIINPTASGSRRFTRPKSSSAINSGPSSSFSPNRGRSSGRIQATPTVFGSSSRRGGFRSSSINPSSAGRASSGFNPNNRFRIRPTVASTLNRGPNSNAVTLPSTISDEENDLTTQITESSGGDENETTAATTTVDGARRSQNPLLRFRRPPLTRAPTTPRTTTKVSGNSHSKSGNKVATTTTPKPNKSAYNRPNAIQARARPGNALFPRRNLFTTTTQEPEAEEEEEQVDDLEEGEGDNDDVEESEGVDEDTDFEGSNTNTRTERAPAQVQIRPFIRPFRRVKRQVYSRFRRPTSRTTAAPIEEEPETEAPAPKLPTRKGFIPRGRTRNEHTTTPRIAPTRPSLNHRSQFTLRDSNNIRSSNFRRPSTSSPSIRKPTTRPSRLRTQTESSNNSRKTPRGRTKQTNRRTPSRGTKNNNKDLDYNNNYVNPSFDGTITVTHQIPTEVTIPVVNGKVTEYKNIVTAKLSTEILGPNQYSTTVNPLGQGITILLSESTGFAANGGTQITRFTLNETPTTAIIFTPTYIRGRKTSFSHVIPSTVYMVDQVVNTIAPSLPQAPLANILLSQLLLGNQGIQQGNPLLGLQNLQNANAEPATPTTEFKTRSTTYVTTVTAETSTVIPLTFRGKEILTTIIDTSVNVITATEFITDTVVVTPTPTLQANNQLNSLLVPFLLQQQQQQVINPLFQQPAGVFNTNEDLFKKALFQEQEKQNLAIDEAEEDLDDYQSVDEVTEAPKRKTRKKPKKPAPTPAQPEKETSVITLYVSGRTPGEFSTVLSTVIVGEENKRKREATYIPVKPSQVPDDLIISTLEYVDAYLMPAITDITNTNPNQATDSLESILGDISKQIVTDTPVKATKPGSYPTKKYNIKYAKNSGSQQQQHSGNFLAL